MPTITRRVKIDFNVENKEQLKDCYKKIFSWQKIVHKAANYIATQFYIQDQIKDLFYLTDEIKIKLANIQKDPEGIFTTSRDNTTYQLLSKKFKGECPMGMLSGLNTIIAKTYKKESSEICKGEKSLRTYRDTVPMPIRSADTSNWKKQEDGNYTFFVYGTSFKTYFGRDLSGNELMFDRAISGDYKLCDSSIQLIKDSITKKWKMFYLAVFSFEKQEIKLDKNKVANCFLHIDYPIIIKEKEDKFYYIGKKEEYLHGRLAIKNALRRVQINSAYNQGGKGRKKKLRPMDYFLKAEINYVDNKMHNYSRKLIDYCIKHGIGKIVLTNFTDTQQETHKETEESKYLLSSWSYFNIADKIKYKAGVVGIEVEKQ